MPKIKATKKGPKEKKKSKKTHFPRAKKATERKRAHQFNMMEGCLNTLTQEMTLLRDRLDVAENDKKKLHNTHALAVANLGSAGGGGSADAQAKKWRKDFKTTLKFNVGPTENVEEFMRELDHPVQRQARRVNSQMPKVKETKKGPKEKKKSKKTHFPRAKKATERKRSRRLMVSSETCRAGQRHQGSCGD
eukprot:SAG11_NODE_789_length_7139_cov_5.205607_9_plen_191_part_00